MLAAVAPLTSRVTLGTAALLPVLRRPVQAAQTLASIDLLSGAPARADRGRRVPRPVSAWPQHVLSEVPWSGGSPGWTKTVALWRQLWAAPEAGGSFQGSLLRFEQLPAMTAPSRQGGPPVVARRRVGVGAAAHRTALRRVDALPRHRPTATRKGGRRARRGRRGRPRRGGGGHPRCSCPWWSRTPSSRAVSCSASSPRRATGCHWSSWSRSRPLARASGRGRGENCAGTWRRAAGTWRCGSRPRPSNRSVSSLSRSSS